MKLIDDRSVDKLALWAKDHPNEYTIKGASVTKLIERLRHERERGDYYKAELEKLRKETGVLS